MPRRSTLFAFLCLAAMSGTPALADTPARPVVLELFTSQGCNACPPADALLGELAKAPDVIALAFHVDYWDRLGWRDPYGSVEHTQRQSWYGRALRSASVYTPQLMVAGRRGVVGNQRGSVQAALAEARKLDAVAVQASVMDGQLRIMLPPAVGRRYSVSVAAYLPEAATPVPSGENAGRTLKEFNIVRAFRTVGMWDESRNNFSVPIAGLPADATHVAVLVQDAERGPIVGAAKVKVR